MFTSKKLKKFGNNLIASILCIMKEYKITISANYDQEAFEIRGGSRTLAEILKSKYQRFAKELNKKQIMFADQLLCIEGTHLLM